MKTRMVAATMTIGSAVSLGCPAAADPNDQAHPQWVAAESSATIVASRPEAPAVPTASPDTAGKAVPSPGPPPAMESSNAAPPTTTGATAAPEQAGGIETVVVTARRTAENVQRVPVAITAFSDKDLQREQISSGQDLAGRVPSLVISSNAETRNTETPTIRGQGATFAASPGVIMYYAEVPLPNDQFSNGQGGPGKFFDLANLQVLKGSQGTLFGRNTTGGALLLEPHKPDPQFEASLRADASNYDGQGLEGILNLPLVDDQLYLRVGAKWYERDGFTKDVVTNKDYDSKGFRTMRLGLMWKPSDSVQNYLLTYYTHSADTGTGTVINNINRDGLNYFFYTEAYGLAPGLLPPPSQQVANQFNLGCAFLNVQLGDKSCGQSLLNAQQARGVRATQLSADPDDILDTDAVIDTFSYQFAEALTLRNIASYSAYKHHYRWDLDGSQLPLDDLNGPDNSNSSDIASYTEELQLQGTAFDRTLKFVQGIYYQSIEPTGTQQNINTALGLSDINQTFAVSQRSYGPYAQGTYDLGGLFDALEGLNFTAGARYSLDDTNGSSGEVINVVGTKLTGGTPQHSAQIRNEAPTYTFGFDYKIPTTLIYGKISRGYKSGGFAATAVNPANYTFKPEFVTNYEVGHKSDFYIGDAPVRVNSALYYTDYSDMQRSAEDTYHDPNATNPLSANQFGGATYNVGKAEIMGFETDATVQPFEGFTLMANYSLTYAKYKEFTITAESNAVPVIDCSGQPIANGSVAHLECVPFQFAPKHQFSVSSRYTLPLDQRIGTVEGTATFAWNDRQYSSGTTVPQAEPGAWLDTYGLLNASVNWSGIYGSAADLQFYGTNLTDRTYRISNSNVWQNLYFQSSIYGEPRIVGLQFSYHWGR